MSKPDKKLFLLDAMALIYRAHFAFSKNPRVNSKGVNTGAVYGFTNSLLEILQKEKPTHIGVAFDTEAPTFRHKEYEEYKAQREKQPEDIKAAKPYIRDIIKAFNIPILELDGFEADDIIGTIAKKACRAGFEVFMMTPDKDYSQLVEEHIYLYKPAYMGNAVDILGVPEVLKKWDIERVEQVTDILGLQGDSVDNIPGIPGIGPKTASKLIREYGSVENIIANLEQLKGKQKENVETFAEQGILSKYRATIDIKVPIEFEPEALEYTSPNDEALKDLFTELEFRSTLGRLYGDEAKTKATPTKKARPAVASPGQMSMFGSPAVEGETLPEPPPVLSEVPAINTIDTVVHHYHLIDSPELREELIRYLKAQKTFCFDTETDNIDAFEATLVGLSFAWHSGEAYYVPLPAEEAAARKIVEEFREILESEEIGKTGQNLKYDLLVLKKYGIAVGGMLFDTMLAHYLIEPDMRHGMDLLAETYLNYKPVSITELIGSKGKNQLNMREVPVEEVAPYACEDADITLQLKDKLEPELKKQDLIKLFREIEAPLVKVLAEMEFNGITLDTAALQELSVSLEEDLKAIEQSIYETAGETFNIGSPKQLGEILFDKLKLSDKPKKTKTGQYATGEDILSKLANKHQIANEILTYRELSKLRSTYVEALPLLISPRDGRLHTSFNQAVTSTGRLSSTNPNLQNIPIRTEKGREIRKAFVSRGKDFTLMAADYSQIELRIMAAFAKDESMIEAFRSGRDIHATTAAKIFKVPLEEVDSDMRRKAKTANFGIIYGISAFGLSERLAIPRKEAADIIEAYFQEFPAVKDYMDRCINQAREKEYVETLLGRRRYLRDINSRNATVRGYAERNAINAPIQGSAADMIKLAMVQIYQWMEKEKLRSKMILQVHDELVFDVHLEELELMKKQVEHFMAHALELEVPMEIGIGTGSNWLEAH